MLFALTFVAVFFKLLISSPIHANNEMLQFPFKNVTDGTSKALLQIMLEYSRKTFAIPREKFDVQPPSNNNINKNAFLTHCKFIKENFGGIKGIEMAIARQKNEKIREKLTNFLENVKNKMSENIVEDEIYNDAFSRLSVLFEIKTKNLVATTRECATEFSILRTFYKMAEFILHNAYTNNFDKRADRLTAFWCQSSKNEHSKPPRIGVNTFQKTHSAIKIFYANMVHILNLKTGDELLKLLMANLRPLQKPNETAKQKNANKLENCDEIIEELNNMKWLENAILDDRIGGLNMKEIYEKILEEFNNRRNSANTVEASIACSSEFFKLHSINYLTQFVLEHIVQSALTSTSDLLYKMYRIEMEHLREAFNIFLHKHLGTVEDQIDIGGGSDAYCADDEDEDGGTHSVGTEQYYHMHQVGEGISAEVHHHHRQHKQIGAGIEAEHIHIDKARKQVEEGIEVGGRLHLDGKMIADDHHQQPAAAGEGVEGNDRNEPKDVDQDTDNEYHDIEDDHSYHDNQSDDDDDEMTVEEYHDFDEQFQEEHQSEDGHDEKKQ